MSAAEHYPCPTCLSVTCHGWCAPPTVEVEVELIETTRRTITVTVPVGLVREDVAGIAKARLLLTPDDQHPAGQDSEMWIVDGHAVVPDPCAGLHEVIDRTPPAGLAA